MSTPAMPVGLSERSGRVWQSERRRSKSAGRLLLLEQCLRAIDRADELRAVIDREGLTSTTRTTGALHIHPLAKLETEHRSLFVKLARALRLEWQMDVDGGRE
jgi:hypothetical protein